MRTARVNSIRRRLDEKGLKTLCLWCGHRGRHKIPLGAHVEGRLRDSRCGICKAQGMVKPLWWVRDDADSAFKCSCAEQGYAGCPGPKVHAMRSDYRLGNPAHTIGTRH